MLDAHMPQFIGTVTRNPNIARMIASCTNQAINDIYPFCEINIHANEQSKVTSFFSVQRKFCQQGGVPVSKIPYLHLNRYPQQGLCGDQTPVSHIDPVVDKLFNTAELSTGILLIANNIVKGQV